MLCSSEDQRFGFGAINETGDNRTCDGTERLASSAYRQESKIPFVFQAVYAFAHALHAMLQAACSHIAQRSRRIRCMTNQHIDGEALYKEYILNVSFLGQLRTRTLFYCRCVSLVKCYRAPG